MIRKEIKSTTHLLINHNDGVTDIIYIVKFVNLLHFISNILLFNSGNPSVKPPCVESVLVEVVFRYTLLTLLFL